MTFWTRVKWKLDEIWDLAVISFMFIGACLTVPVAIFGAILAFVVVVAISCLPIAIIAYAIIEAAKIMAATN